MFGGLSPVGVSVAEIKHYNLRDNKLMRPSSSCIEELTLFFMPLNLENKIHLISTKQNKRFSLRLFSSSQVLSQDEDKILASIARKNFAFLKHKKWLHYYETHEEAMIIKDPPQTYYLAFIEDNGLARKQLAHFKIAPGGYVTNSIAKNHAQNCEHLIDLQTAEEVLSILFGSPQGFIQMESIEGAGKEFHYPLIRNDSSIAEIIQFCGELPFALPLLLSAHMIATFPNQAIGSLGLNRYPYLKKIFRTAAFYGTSAINISSSLAEAVSIEPLHIGPLLDDFNSKSAPPYRVSFWPPYATCYPWGAIMFTKMIEAMKRELSIDFANEIEIQGPDGKPIFEKGYHEQFCADQLNLAIKSENTLSESAEDNNSHFLIASPYRSVINNQLTLQAQ
ncbi:MAG: hypothetical protein ACK5QQ_11310 [Cyanobacteriota bacterium]